MGLCQEGVPVVVVEERFRSWRRQGEGRAKVGVPVEAEAEVGRRHPEGLRAARSPCPGWLGRREVEDLGCRVALAVPRQG